MPYFIRIEKPDDYDAAVRADMERWWHGHCRHHHLPDGRLLVETRGRLNLYGGVERLASFGVEARVVRRDVDPCFGWPMAAPSEHVPTDRPPAVK